MTYSRHTFHFLQRLFLLVSLTIPASVLTAAPSSETVRDSVETYFRLNSHELDTAYYRNGERLDTCFRTLAESPTMNITGVNVVGAASPEGGDRLNDRLSHDRAESLLSHISRTILLPDSLVAITPAGRDWAGMRRLVAGDTAFPQRREVLAILDSYPSDLQADPSAEDECMHHIMQLDGGDAYQYLRENIFPQLRKATLVVEYDRPGIDYMPALDAGLEQLPVDMLSPSVYDLIDIPEYRDTRRPFYMTLKTNMLYDLAAVPNLSAEFYLGRNWSVSADGMYAWWSKDSRQRYWRIYGGELTVRRWFGSAAGRKPLTGHHVGAYAGAVTFDFEWGKRGYMGGLPKGTLLDRCMVVGGVEYGYSLPVASRINIDFTIGIGYFGGKYIKYDPVNGKYFEDSVVKLNYFGPTKAEVSLVWLIGHGNRNSGK